MTSDDALDCLHRAGTALGLMTSDDALDCCLHRAGTALGPCALVSDGLSLRLMTSDDALDCLLHQALNALCYGILLVRLDWAAAAKVVNSRAKSDQQVEGGEGEDVFSGEADGDGRRGGRDRSILGVVTGVVPLVLSGAAGGGTEEEVVVSDEQVIN